MDRLAGGRANAYWYNPRNGKWRNGESDVINKSSFKTDIISGPKAPAQYFDAPGKAEDGNDWVLVLEVN